MGDLAGSSGVLPISRGRSSAVARAAVDALNTRVLEPHFGKGIDDAARAELSEWVAMALDANTRPGRAAFGWGVAGFLALALAVGAAVVTWDKIASVETRLDKADHYAQTLANYLVVSAHRNHENAESTDQLLRALATAQGVDTSHIDKPTESPPPAPVQRRSAEYLEGQGE
jgi:hypothetical protein